MLWRYLFYAFLIYLAYRFIFNFLLPVYKTTKQVKKQFRDIHSRMNDFGSQQESNQRQYNPGNTQSSKPEAKEQVGDYIDFEELK